MRMDSATLKHSIGTNNSFKIVAVIKKRGTSHTIEYCYVPHQWEQNGVLYWPQANLRILRMDPGTKPEADWRTYKCKVKKSNIIGLEEAELWEEEFVNCGTDAEERSSALNSKSADRLKNQIKRDITGLNAAFEKINKNNSDEGCRVDIDGIPEGQATESGSGSYSDSCPAFAESSSYSYLPKQNIVTTNASQPEVIGNSQTASTVTVNQPSRENQDLNDKLDLILKNQLRIIEMIQTESSYQKATAEKLYKMLKENQTSRNLSKNIEEEDSVCMEHAAKFAFPLREVTEVLSLNKELETNREYYSYLVNTYSTIGGTSGDEEGRLLAKKLRNTLFTDHVLTLFSWTGVSRTSTLKKKEAFQKCEGILKFFQEVVSLADSRWSLAKNEKYFKDNTLKHANQTERNKEKCRNKGNEEYHYEQNEVMIPENPVIVEEFLMGPSTDEKIGEFKLNRGEFIITESDGDNT